jgi:hypothetical protein
VPKWLHRGSDEGRRLRHRLLVTLVRAGLAVATPGVVQAGGRALGVARLAITEMGRATVGA